MEDISVTTRRTPLLLVLDGVLSQDENQTRDAMMQMVQLVPTLKPTLFPTSIGDEGEEEQENDLVADVLLTFRSGESLTRIIFILLEAYPKMVSIPSGHDGSLPLHFAASIGNVPLARLLLERFPDAASQPNSKGKIPLHYAAREGRTNMVIYLLRAMPQTAAIESKKRKLALHFAAGEGHTEVVRALLSVHPAGASLTSGKGKLPLHFAARWGHMEIAQDLCRIYPASCHSLDWEGSLPLHDAAREGQLQMATFLVQRHPEGLSKANIRGEIPLFPAIRSGNVELVVYLLKSWPRGGKHILQNIRPDDNVEEWDESILELCLRGAVENFSDCALIQDAPQVAAAAASATGSNSLSLSSLRHPVQSSSNDEGAATVAPSSDLHVPQQDSSIVVGLVSSRPQTPPSMMEITLPRSKSPILEGMGSRKKRSQSSTLLEGDSNKRSRCGSISSDGEEEEVELKYRRTLSRPFIPLHAALESGVTCHVLKCVLKRYPYQLKLRDGLGRFPLHLAVANCDDGTTCCHKSRCCGSNETSESQDEPSYASRANADKMSMLVLKYILDPFPKAATMRDYSGWLPLHWALATRADSRVIQELLNVNPSSGVEPCQVLDPPHFANALPIFMATEYNCDLSTVYTLLRRDPGVIQSK